MERLSSAIPVVSVFTVPITAFVMVVLLNRIETRQNGKKARGAMNCSE